MNTRNNKTKSKHSTTKGFTLIELLFATIILGVMLTMTITTFIGVFRFYNWAGTTRINQQNSRQIMDDISRLVASRTVNINASTRNLDGTYSGLCLINEGGGSIRLDSGQLLAIQLGSANPTYKVTEYSYPNNPNCNSTYDSFREISDNINTKVTKLEFDIVYGALNNSIYTSDPNDPKLKRSVEFTIDVINGTPIQGTNDCKVGDNFCDKATYTSAVSER